MTEIKSKRKRSNKDKKDILIHLDPELAKFYTQYAKTKGFNRKNYIETLCEVHAREEFEKMEKLKNKQHE